VGGLRNVSVLLERPGQIHTDDFVGCIHSLEINGRPTSLSSPLDSHAVSESCQRVPNVCDSSNHKCGASGQCVDLWDSYTCLCSGVTAPNCDEALAPYTFRSGAFVELRIGEKYRRHSLLQTLYISYRERPEAEVPTKSISFNFRTMERDGILLYAASNRDYTLLEVRRA
jgi:protocadherin Fat 4